MANIELTGTLIEKGEVVVKSETYRVRESVVEVAGEKYSNFFKFQLSNDRCAKIDSAKVGDTIELKCNLVGRKWEKDGKTSYFTTIEAWYVKVVSAAPTNNAPVTTPPTDETKKGEGGLPF